MKKAALILAIIAVMPHACFAGAAKSVIFASFADSGEQLSDALVLAESVRTFGGAFKNAPIRIYVPEGLAKAHPKLLKRFIALGAEVKTSEAPLESRDFHFARKVFAAARAEAEARGKAAILVWMDEDTVVLKEPRAAMLAEGKSLGYRPVMHQNIGSLYSEKPDAFWSRVYEKLSVKASTLFPMKAVADGKTLRPYFNAGLLVVRPERGILKRWAECFPILYRDPALIEMCTRDQRMRVFLHQAALTGAILNLLAKDEMTQLPDSYNYPIFFKEMHGAGREFHGIDGVITLRYDVYFQNPAPDWGEKLEGSLETVSWLKERLGKDTAERKETSTKMRYHFQQGKTNTE